MSDIKVQSHFTKNPDLKKSNTSIANSSSDEEPPSNLLGGGLGAPGGMKKAVSTISLSTICEDGEREVYSNFAEYMLSCVGFAVGLGNVWRFPKVCLENGGGAFLIPYFIILLVEGIPIMMLELTIGQRFRGSPVHAYGRMNKHLWGLGLGMAMTSLFCSLYYNTILAWGFVYFFNSFQQNLPWLDCARTAGPECEVDPASYYFQNEVLNRAKSVDETFEPTWNVYFACLIAWGVVYMCLQGGVKSSGKVVYFTCLFPYFVLSVLCVIGITLPGSEHGLAYVFTPDFSKITEPKVWVAALEQIFFSAGIGFGGMISMSSCMPVKNKTYKDAFVILGMNSFTSLFAATGIFSIKGHMAWDMFHSCANGTAANGTLPLGCKEGFSIMDYVAEDSSGSGLIFVTMAKAVNVVSSGYGAMTLSLMLYLMVITLGLDSAFGTIEGYVPAFKELPALQKLGHGGIVKICVGASAVVSIVFCSNHGEFFIDLFDKYGCVLILVYLGFFELVAVWVYGMKNLDRDFKMMNGRRIPWLIKASLLYITPALLAVSIIRNYAIEIAEGTVFAYTNYNTGAQLILPWWAVIIALFLFFMGALWVPGAALITYLLERNSVLLDWGRADFNYAEAIADIPAEEYLLCEQKIFCVGRVDFEENENKDDEEVNRRNAEEEV